MRRTCWLLLFLVMFVGITQTVAIAGPQIIFDYSRDTNGFFTNDRRGLLQQAAEAFTSRLGGTNWARVDTSQSGGSYDLAFINPSSLEVSWLSNVIIPENQITIYVGATDFRVSPWERLRSSKGDGATQLMSIRNVTGGVGNVLTDTLQYRPVNASITFDLGGVQGFGSNGGVITRQWHFDSDGNLQTDDRNPSDPHFYDYSDFYSTAIHEIGHVLGIHNPDVFRLMAGLDYDSGFCLAYMSQVQSDGVGGYVFTGTKASQHYFAHVGQNIPLDTDTKCHFADGVRSDTSNGWISLSYESNMPFRVGFSELEFGALQDIGYTVSPSACTYTLTPTNNAFSPSLSTGSIAVTVSSSSCTWTATGNAAWITVTSGAGGTGTGTVAYSIAANTGSARTGTITAGGQTFTITQAGWTYTNSIGSQNSIKVTDMSGTLPTAGGTISVTAWDANGNTIPESGSALPLKLYSNGTTTISGTNLASRFTARTPALYGITADSSRLVITNVKTSTDGTLNIPTGYTSDTTNFVTNSVGPRNSIKITDMSGVLSSSGGTITVKAWDTNGVTLTESGTAAALKVYSNGTTTIPGPELMARFPAATPMSYEFTVDSSKLVLTNVKSSADGSINIPYGYAVGMTNFVANSIGDRNTIKITDMSGTLSATGEAITILAWDANGIAIPESSSATPLKLYSHGTTSIPGPNLTARFPDGSPMAYEFSVASTQYIITNVKSSADTSINIPYVYTNGTTKYATNFVSSKTSIRISDLSGTISGGTATISVSAWDVDGNSVVESGSAIPLTLGNNATTSISGSDLVARFPSGPPVSYEFTIGSSQYEVTGLTSNTEGTISIPAIYTSGVAGGI